MAETLWTIEVMKHDAGVSGGFGAGWVGRRVLAAGLGSAFLLSTVAAGGQTAGSSADVFEEKAEEPAQADEEANQFARLTVAREAFLEGRRLMGEAKWTEAALAFERAISAQSTPGLHYHLGLCLEQGGDPLRARQAYLDAQRLLAEQPAADVAALLPAAVRRVEQRLSRFELVIQPEKSAVWIDDLAVVEAPPDWLAAGAHWLHAEAEGYEPLDRRFVVTAGAPTHLEVVLRTTAPAAASMGAVTPTAPAPEAARAEPLILPKVAFWGSIAFAGLGTAAGVAGIAWRVDASARVTAAQAELDQQGQTGDSACLGPPEQTGAACQDLRAAVADEESANVLLVGGFVAAGVGVLGAITSWAVWPHENFALGGRVGLGVVRVELSGRF